jgi:undecaprenyl diphosphate synthase
MTRANTPKHIAIIMDGNGRWARARELERHEGHRQGATKAALAFRACHERKVDHLTLYAFSYSNWKRPQAEVDLLMQLCGEFCGDNRAELVERGIRLQMIGELEELPTRTRHEVETTIADTEAGSAMVLTLALGYGGRNDLVGAVRAIAARAQAGLLLPEEIDEQALRAFMTTAAIPDPDLVIRTGGEQRLSDFLLFESANSELYFSGKMWPDFDERVLDEAIEAYGRRQRRFGHTAEQLSPDRRSSEERSA